MKLTDDKIIVKKCSNKTAGGIFVADIGQKTYMLDQVAIIHIPENMLNLK
jgi:ribosomal silencing factor RsfS